MSDSRVQVPFGRLLVAVGLLLLVSLSLGFGLGYLLWPPVFGLKPVLRDMALAFLVTWIGLTLAFSALLTWAQKRF